MQPAPRPLSEQPLGEPPLPPATTHHIDSGDSAEETTLAAPFLPRTPDLYAPEHASAPVDPGPDGMEGDAGAAVEPGPLPWEESPPATAGLPAPQHTWEGVPTVEPESIHASDSGTEPLMPWEEYLTLGSEEAEPSAEPVPDFGVELGDIANLAQHGAETTPAEAEPWAELTPADPGWELPTPQGETGEAAPAWGDEAVSVEPAGFPLDAFIVPRDAHRPSGMEEGLREQAEALAVRLEALAARLRVEGFIPLVRPSADAQPIDQLIATLLAGYISR